MGSRARSLFAAVVAAGTGLVVFVEWHTDEPTVVLAVLVAVGFAAGWIVPRRSLAAGACLGFAVLVAHALSTATGLAVPRYQLEPPSVGDWIAMALLAVPAALASKAGSRLARDARERA